MTGRLIRYSCANIAKEISNERPKDKDSQDRRQTLHTYRYDRRRVHRYVSQVVPAERCCVSRLYSRHFKKQVVMTDTLISYKEWNEITLGYEWSIHYSYEDFVRLNPNVKEEESYGLFKKIELNYIDKIYGKY